jgi:hypothetical protein
MRREEDVGRERQHLLKRAIQAAVGHGGGRPSLSRRRAVSSETLTVERGVTADQTAKIQSRMNAAGETGAARTMTRRRAQRKRRRRTIRTAGVVAEGVD